MFQSTRPRGARPHARSAWERRRRCFNPRAREGRDRPWSRRCRRCACFNPRAREGRDTLAQNSPKRARGFQSTRPRGARPRPHSMSSGRCTRFNPRAREGRDPGAWATSPTISSFNPRAREGRDMTASVLICVDCVSIHAPARGATKRSTSLRVRQQFQSTRPRGARRNIQAVHRPALRFQSTRPRGARPTRTYTFSIADERFNPRAREGRDAVMISR